MKLSILAIVTLAAGVLSAKMPQKAVIVTYPKDTPSRVIDQAMDAIRSAGGAITHEYSLIKGFAARAPAKVLESVQTWGNEFNAVIEEDQMVSVLGRDAL